MDLEELGSKIELGGKMQGIWRSWGVKSSWGVQGKGSGGVGELTAMEQSVQQIVVRNGELARSNEAWEIS